MRGLALNLLKKCKFKWLELPRGVSTEGPQPVFDIDKAADDGDLLEVLPSWSPDEAVELRAAVMRDMRVIPHFISKVEEAALMQELEPRLRRMRYEFDHWDNAIEGYRETERSQWQPENEAVLERVRRIAFTSEDIPLPYVHVLDLAPGGHISPHVDAVRFCGGVIAGVCLLSPAVMLLQASSASQLALRALLPRRSLYIMRGVARYEFTHAVPGGEDSAWRGRRVVRTRRVSVICRSRPAPSGCTAPAPSDCTAPAEPEATTDRKLM